MCPMFREERLSPTRGVGRFDFGILMLAQFGSLFWPTLWTNGYSDSGEARSGGDSLDWRAKVELFEQIRREYEFGVGTIAGVAKKLGVHRRMVREAIGSALPKPRKKTERPRWKLKAAVEFIDAMLEADRKAPRKQRHTAHRIWARIQQ